MRSSVYCCSLRTCVLAVGVVFLACQTALLVLNFLLMNNVEHHVENAIEWFEDGVEKEDMLGGIKEQAIRVRVYLHVYNSAYKSPYDSMYDLLPKASRKFIFDMFLLKCVDRLL
jgi:hypothetical protein